MKKITKIAALAVLVMGVAAMLQPANAICANPRAFSSGYAYVVTPGCEGNDCGSNSSSVTDDLVGMFWAIGDGNPDPGLGQDNGTFPALGGWFYIYPGYAAAINSSWAADPGIDGCIDVSPDPVNRCMAILVMDNTPDTGVGAFALMTDARDAESNYTFDPGMNITLTTLDKLSINATVAVGDTIDVSVGGIDLSGIEAGLYLDPACDPGAGGAPEDVIAGYQLFLRRVPAGADPPDTDASQWMPVGPVTPLGDPAPAVNVDCTSGEDAYITVGVVFDSAFGNVWLSGNSTKINCDSNLADPADIDIERKPRNREKPRSRSLGR